MLINPLRKKNKLSASAILLSEHVDNLRQTEICKILKKNLLPFALPVVSGNKNYNKVTILHMSWEKL